MSLPPDDSGPSSSDLLRSMVEESTQDELRSAEDAARDLLARLEEAEVETPLTPDELAAIEEVTSDPDASLGFRSLRAKVESGAVTWDEVWREPEHHGPEAVRLVFAVLAQSARTMPSMDEIVEASEQLPGAPRDPGAPSDAGPGAGRREDPPTGTVLGR